MPGAVTVAAPVSTTTVWRVAKLEWDRWTSTVAVCELAASTSWVPPRATTSTASTSTWAEPPASYEMPWRPPTAVTLRRRRTTEPVSPDTLVPNPAPSGAQQTVSRSVAEASAEQAAPPVRVLVTRTRSTRAPPLTRKSPIPLPPVSRSRSCT